MAKTKTTRHSGTLDSPAANGRRSGAAASDAAAGLGSRSSAPPVWRDFVMVLLILLAMGATAFIWLDQRPPPRLGLMLTAVVWLVALAGLLGRLQARRTVRELHAILAHHEIVSARLEPNITEEQTGLRMRHVSAWLVAALGIAATAVLWNTHAIERRMGGLSAPAVGATVSVMLALAVAANTINRQKTKRLMRDLRVALNSERLALSTLGGLDVMISACLPTGERTRFNEGFLELVGRTAAQMQGHGWLEIVHPDDRQDALELAAKPLNGGARHREHDMRVKHHSGEFMWLHETLTPRIDDNAALIEFICTAINITHHVVTESALDKELGQVKSELADVKNELSKTKTSRNRFEKGLEEARDDVKNLQDALAKAEASVEKTKTDAAARITDIKLEAEERVGAIEKSAETRVARLEDSLKSTRVELQQSSADNKRVTRAFEKLQEEMGQLRQEDGALREQITRHIKETREANAKTTEARTSEAQQRGKIERTTQRCAELETQLTAKEKSLSAALSHAQEATAKAQEAAANAAAIADRRAHDTSAEALATQLRKQLTTMQRVTSELLGHALDGPVQDAAHNAAATVRAMSDLVDQALNGHAAGASRKSPSAASAARTPSATATSFDLRRTANGVRDLLIDDAKAKGVQLEFELASSIPALVHGDDIEIRTALMSLTDAALHLVQDGTLKMRMSEDANTAAHSTIRCELSHSSARVKSDALEATLATKSTDSSMPEPAKQPLAHQSAKAWRTIRSLQGQHGYMLPDSGGFSLWFTFTLDRPAARGGPPIRDVSRTASPSRSLRDALSTLTELAPTGAAAHTPSSTNAGTIAPMSKDELAPSDPSAPRQMPRMPQEMLTCNLGEVIELGGESMRVFCGKSPKHPDVTIKFDDVEMGAELHAEVIWSKKIAGRKHDVGLKFLALTPEQQKRIMRIAMQHRKVTTMLDADQPG